MAHLRHHEATDHVITLTDGRRLGYAAFGDPDGEVIVNCHGGLVSRNDVQPNDADARALGVCVISPDRPGVGLSDRNPGHGQLDWVTGDLTELLDRLGVDRFSVMGWSAGGQYALATAVGRADRGDRAAVIAGCLPIDDPGTFAELDALDRRLVTWSTRRPAVARAYFRASRQLAERAPGRLIRISAGQLEGRDTGSLAALGDWFPHVMAEGVVDVHGAVDDYRAYAAPWGFRPEDVTVPVDLYQGTDDALVPRSWADALHRRIPRSTLTVIDGGGHLIAVSCRRQVMEGLRSSPGH
ncbi:MAG: alpha/beta fold hydrolase [Acidimicrobiales bacterium]